LSLTFYRNNRHRAFKNRVLRRIFRPKRKEARGHWRELKMRKFRSCVAPKRSRYGRYSYWLRAGRPRGRSSSPGRVKNFRSCISSRPALEPTQSRVPGALSRGVKRPGREADHSPPASAEVKKMWNYTSIYPYVFMA
jgi:hypothetical protein